MKKLNLLFTALLLLCCIGTAKAEEVTIDGIRYDVVTKAKVATVIKGGNYSGYIVIPETFEHNGATYSVTSIGNSAFSGCSGLTSIEIPNSVTSIGDYAFKGCTGLTSVEIPNSVTSIGCYAFEDCSSLTSVEFNAENCTNMGNATAEAFTGCTALSTVTIGENVKTIPDYAFCYCSGLTSVEIPNSVTNIGGSAFSCCTGLTSVEIPSSVTSIGSSAFYRCSSLTSIEIPNSVTSIGYQAFSHCSGLTSIEIPNSVTSIGGGAFSGCTGLTSVEIPNSVTSIEGYAFSSCSGLTSVEIPNSVTSIGWYAFNGCTGLTSVTIGNGVSYIGSKAFASCSNLIDVYCLATSVPSTDATAFNESYPEYMTLYVPAEAIDSYKATTPWSSFGTIVTLDGDIVETPKCANPVIEYKNGKIEIDCETADAEFITTVTNSYTGNYYSNNFELTATYNISVYAMATGCKNSETVNATLCWIECECNNSDDTGVINIPAKSVLVTSNGGVLSISCQLNGEEVAVYTTAGTLIGTTTIDNGVATIATGLSKGTVAIVKIAGKSIKVIID